MIAHELETGARDALCARRVQQKLACCGERATRITTERNGGEEPKVAYSPVTITQWQPEERKY